MENDLKQKVDECFNVDESETEKEGEARYTSFTFKTQFDPCKYLQKREFERYKLDYTDEGAKLVHDATLSTLGEVRECSYKIAVITALRYYIAAVKVDEKTHTVDEIKLLESGEIDEDFDIIKYTFYDYIIIVHNEKYSNIKSDNNIFEAIFNNNLFDKGARTTIDGMCCLRFAEILNTIEKISDLYYDLLKCNPLTEYDMKVSSAVYSVKNEEVCVDIICQND